jgi:serine/threonine protein kinase
VKEILYPIIKAVKHLHDNKIIHRDLKLENIMMTDKSDKAQPKIIDFGLAKILHLN